MKDRRSRSRGIVITGKLVKSVPRHSASESYELAMQIKSYFIFCSSKQHGSALCVLPAPWWSQRSVGRAGRTVGRSARRSDGRAVGTAVGGSSRRPVAGGCQVPGSCSYRHCCSQPLDMSSCCIAAGLCQ